MSKRADLAIGAVLSAIRTELSLVLLNMVESFDVAVSHVAVVSQLTRPSFLVLAEVRRVDAVLTPSINLRVEVLAHLILVDASLSALGHLEHAKFEVVDVPTV